MRSARMSWRALELELRVAGSQDGQHHLGQDVRGGRDQVESADAAHVRLQELEALLPARRPEVDGRVVAADHRVLLAHRRRPVTPEPGLLAVRQGQDRPHVRVGEVQLREALERAVERERDGPHVGELVGQRGDRGGEDADGLLNVVAQVDEVLGARAAVDLRQQGAQLGLGDPVHRLLDPRGEPCPGEARLLDRRQHGTQPSIPPRFGTIADRNERRRGLPRAAPPCPRAHAPRLVRDPPRVGRGCLDARGRRRASRRAAGPGGAAPAPAGDRPAAGRPPRGGRGAAGHPAGAGDPVAVNLRELRDEYEKARLVPASLVEDLAASPRCPTRPGAPPASTATRACSCPGSTAWWPSSRPRPIAWRAAGTATTCCSTSGSPVSRGRRSSRCWRGSARRSGRSSIARSTGAGRCPACLARPVDVRLQAEVARELAEWLGFDFASGRLDEAMHPSTIRVGPGDVRLTTRFRRRRLHGRPVRHAPRARPRPLRAVPAARALRGAGRRGAVARSPRVPGAARGEPSRPVAGLLAASVAAAGPALRRRVRGRHRRRHVAGRQPSAPGRRPDHRRRAELRPAHPRPRRSRAGARERRPRRRRSAARRGPRPTGASSASRRPTISPAASRTATGPRA